MSLALPAGAVPLGLLCIGPVDRFYETPLLIQQQWRQARPVPALFTTGLALEPVLLDWWMREHGAGLTLSRSPVIRRGWQVGHLDGIAGPFVLDPKTCLQDGIWYLEEEEDIPAGYRFYVQRYFQLIRPRE